MVKKTWEYEVTVTWVGSYPDVTKREAKDMILNQFAEDYNLDLCNKEIKLTLVRHKK